MAKEDQRARPLFSVQLQKIIAVCARLGLPCIIFLSPLPLSLSLSLSLAPLLLFCPPSLSAAVGKASLPQLSFLNVICHLWPLSFHLSLSPFLSLAPSLFAAFSFTHCLYRYARFVPLCKYYFVPVQAASESSAACAPAYRRRLQPIASSSSSRERGGAGAGAWRQVKACQRHELELCTLVRLSQTHTHTHTPSSLSFSLFLSPACKSVEWELLVFDLHATTVSGATSSRLLLLFLCLYFFCPFTSLPPSAQWQRKNKQTKNTFFLCSLAIDLETLSSSSAAQLGSAAVRQLGSNCLLHFFSVIFSSSPSSCPVRSARQEVEKIYAISIDIARD